MMPYVLPVLALAALAVILQVVVILFSQHLGRRLAWYQAHEELFLLLWEFLLNAALFGLAIWLGGYFLG